MKIYNYLIILFLLLYISGCDFNDPYVPESAGSSTLTGYIVTDPVIELNGIEVYLHGKESFADVTDSSGKFSFKNVAPGDYSIQIQKSPYLQDSVPVSVHKATNEKIGNVKTKLLGAISGTIPSDKLSLVFGEFEIVVYINGVPRIPQKNTKGDFVIDLSSPDSKISIRTVTKITVFIDGIPYFAKMADDGNFIVEFVPPGIYNDISVKLNSKDNTLPLISDGTIEVKSGQTRILQTYF